MALLKSCLSAAVPKQDVRLVGAIARLSIQMKVNGWL